MEITVTVLNTLDNNFSYKFEFDPTYQILRLQSGCVYCDSISRFKTEEMQSTVFSVDNYWSINFCYPYQLESLSRDNDKQIVCKLSGLEIFYPTQRFIAITEEHLLIDLNNNLDSVIIKWSPLVMTDMYKEHSLTNIKELVYGYRSFIW